MSESSKVKGKKKTKSKKKTHVTIDHLEEGRDGGTAKRKCDAPTTPVNHDQPVSKPQVYRSTEDY